MTRQYEPPRPERQPATPLQASRRPSRATVADIPAGYLRLYRAAGARYRIPWSVLAAVNKVESDHGRARLPGVRSGSNWAGACGPMQIGARTAPSSSSISPHALAACVSPRQ